MQRCNFPPVRATRQSSLFAARSHGDSGTENDGLGMAKNTPKASQPPVVVRRLISELTYDPENARKHGDADLEAVCKSLKKFKQQTPIVVTPDGVVAKGNGTMMAAQKLGWTHIDTVVTYLTGDELKAYKIADNQTALLSEWDLGRLSEQLIELEEDPALFDALSFDESWLAENLPEHFSLPESEEDEKESPYTRKIEAPIYKPTGECPSPLELFDRGKADTLRDEVLSAGLPPEVTEFLLVAAMRHTVLNFEKIAEFYCHADPKVQELMEKSACVIIDFDKAVENGYVMLGEKLAELYGKEYGGEDD